MRSYEGRAKHKIAVMPRRQFVYSRHVGVPTDANSSIGVASGLVVLNRRRALQERRRRIRRRPCPRSAVGWKRYHPPPLPRDMVMLLDFTAPFKRLRAVLRRQSTCPPASPAAVRRAERFVVLRYEASGSYHQSADARCSW